MAVAARIGKRALLVEGRVAGEIVVYNDQQLIFDRDVVVSMPASCRFPKVRALPDGLALVIDSRTDGQQPNAWLVDRVAGTVGAFNAGDAVADVLVCGERIVVTYFDEGIFGGAPPSDEGVAIFDSRGSFEWGYHTEFGATEPVVADCYAACVDERSRLLFFPYTGFPIVRLDVDLRTRDVFPTPERVHGASAMSASNDAVLLHSPYEERSTIFEITLGTGFAREIGRYAGRLRGLRGGRFLAKSTSGYAIVAPD